MLGTYCTACGECFFCRRGDFHKCDTGRVFGHGATLGSLQGAQAELLLVPNADLTLRRVPDGISDDVALFAGDVMGTGYHAVVECGVEPGSIGRGARPRPGRPLRGPGGARRGRRRAWSRSTRSPSGSRWRASLGAEPVHLTEEDPRGRGEGADRGPRRRRDDRRGRPPRRARARLPADPQGGHRLGDRRLRRARSRSTWAIVWIKALTLKTGHANVIKHVDPVLERLVGRRARPGAARHPPHEPRRGRRRPTRSTTAARR